MKYYLVPLLLVLFVSACGDDTENDKAEKIDPSEEVVVTFADQKLENLVRDELERPSGDITSLDMQELYFLTINEAGVTNLTGLEYALELREFTLMRETVDSLEPLQNLSNLERFIVRYSEIKDLPIKFSESVDLKHISTTGTVIEDISFVEHMTNLEHVTMSDAKITDIAVLEQAVNIKQLNFRGNQISNIDALAEMNQLEVLNLQGNEIACIEALTELESLNDVVLSYNPIANIRPLETLPALQTVVVYLPHETKHLIFEQVATLRDMGIDVSYHR